MTRADDQPARPSHSTLPFGPEPGGECRVTPPAESRGRTVRAATGLTAVLLPLVVYLMTLARAVTPTDSGELAAVAATLGIAHPPGYPLFTLLGWAMAHLVPVETVIFRVGLLSAVAAALTTLVVHRTGLLLVTSPEARRPCQASAPLRSGAGPAAALAALGGALLFAFARTPWSQSVVVEVYTLQALLVMLFLLACAHASRPGGSASRAAPAAGLAAGMALTNHLTGVLLLPGLVVVVLFGLRAARQQAPAKLGWTALALALPLSLYAYLPLRSLGNPAVAWSLIDSPHALLVHMTARQYHGLWGSQGLRWEELSRFLTLQLPGEATPLLAILALVGLAALTRRSPRFALVSALTLALHVAYNLGYPIHDIALYYIPCIAILSLWAAVGAVELVRAAGATHRRAALMLAAILCLAPLIPLRRHWHDNDRHGDTLVACAVRDCLEPLERDAVLFTGRWDTLSSPALYAQAVTGLRPDVLVLDTGQLASPSLTGKLERVAPDLARDCAAELAAVRETGLRAESGQAYDVAEGSAQLERLRRALVLAAAQRRPTSVTSDLYRHPMAAGFILVPEGMSARLATRDRLRPLPLDAIQGPCGRREDLRGPAEELIWDDYRVAFLNRAQVLRRHGLDDEAAAFTRRAATLVRP